MSGYRDLETGATASPKRIGGNVLHLVLSERAGALDPAYAVAGGQHPRAHQRQSGRAPCLYLLAPADEVHDGLHQVLVRSNVMEERRRDDHVELGFHADGKLEQVEGVGREVVDERHLGPQLVITHPEALGYEPPQTRLHGLTPCTSLHCRHRPALGLPQSSGTHAPS